MRERISNSGIREYVERKLEIGFSPGQVAGHLPKGQPGESGQCEHTQTDWYRYLVLRSNLPLQKGSGEHAVGLTSRFQQFRIVVKQAFIRQLSNLAFSHKYLCTTCRLALQ